MSTDDFRPRQRAKNIRLGLTLASVAVVMFIGFIAKLVFFGR